MNTDPDPDPASIFYLVLVMVILVLLSALLSSSETAYSTLNKVRLKNIAADSGKKQARLTVRLSENYDSLISTVLIANNIVNITLTVIATIFFARVLSGDVLAYSETIATVVVTVTVLIFGEVTPKQLAKQYPEKIAIGLAPFLLCVYYILWPLNQFFRGWRFLIGKIFKYQADPSFTEQELLTIVEEAGEEGTLDDSETTLIRSAIEFNDVDVGDILVPRVNVIAIEKNMPMEQIDRLFIENAYSRLPVYEGSIDNIVGMIHEKDFYVAKLRKYTSIAKIIQPIALASEHMKISKLLSLLQKQKVHMAVVVDEYGGTLGIATLEDVLEELVGEIWDEHDEVDDYFVKNDDGSVTVNGNADLGDFFAYFGVDEDLDDDFDANTVGGWVIEKLGTIPIINDSLAFDKLLVVVTKSTRKQVIEVRVTIIEPEDEKKHEQPKEE